MQGQGALLCTSALLGNSERPNRENEGQVGAFTGGAWLWEVGQMPGNTAPAAMVIALQCLQPPYRTGTPHIPHVCLFLSVPFLLMEITGPAERTYLHFQSPSGHLSMAFTLRPSTPPPSPGYYYIKACFSPSTTSQIQEEAYCTALLSCHFPLLSLLRALFSSTPTYPIHLALVKRDH
ncbi:uncharacterized [Tachysurus ichikawai]